MFLILIFWLCVEAFFTLKIDGNFPLLNAIKKNGLWVIFINSLCV
jgi:hypothetical protein